MSKLDKLIGQTIYAVVPLLHETEIQQLKLHDVEWGGLWVESQRFINAMLGKFGVQAAPRTALLFLPYHEIKFAIHSADSPALSEKSFGV